jgi:alkylation response protein AidB-like acyl-CoA dehydrogenase
MTERPGGSDVQNTETWAVYSPLPNKTGPHGTLEEGDYLVSGFKFFSSATDANIAILLAKTPSGKLSAFLAPLTRTVVDENGKEKTVANGIRIHRLKNKLGTKQLPTAELELKDVRAHLVGPLDRGVGTISHILNVTRAWAFMGSLAGMRRCLNIAKSFSKSRTVFGYPLWILPLHLRTLAGLELRIRGLLHLGFYTIALTSFTENSFPEFSRNRPFAPLPKSQEDAKLILRTLTAVTKAVASKTAISSVQECMEALGGVGYMDDVDEPENLARAFRDVSVNAIWEGTTNVLSSEVVRHVLNKNNLQVFGHWLEDAMAQVDNAELRKVLQDAWGVLKCQLDKCREYLFDALANGRSIMFTIAWIVSGTLLGLDACRDNDPVAAEAARRWVINQEGIPREYIMSEVDAVAPPRMVQDGKARAQWDCKLVWGVDLPEFAPFGQRIPLQASKI